MSSVNLGRVQGAGVFYSSAASGTSVALSTVTPTSVKPLSGDTIVFSNGDLRTVTGISGTAVTCGSVIANIKGPKGDTSDPGYTGTFELPGFQSSANDIIMDSITFTSTTNTFTSVGVTPVVGLPVSGTYRRTTNNRFYKWIGTITSISGSTVTITATQGGFTSQSYQHNVRVAIAGMGESDSIRCMLHVSIINNSPTAITSSTDFIIAIQNAGASGGPYGNYSLPATGRYKAGDNKGSIYCIYSTGGPDVTIGYYNLTQDQDYSAQLSQTDIGNVADLVIEL